MQATVFKLARWFCAGAMVLSGCTYEHPGPRFPPDEEAASTPAAAPAPSMPVPSGKKSATSESGRPAASITASSPAIASGNEPVGQPALPVAAPTAPNEETTAGLYPESGNAVADPGSGFDNIEVVGDALKTKLAILRVGSQPTANNLLSVFAGLKNKTSRTLALEVQTIYKDKTGASLNDGSWIPVTLKPHEETDYHSASISPDAVDFLVRVRRAQGGEQ
jgi:hypothetical protein